MSRYQIPHGPEIECQPGSRKRVLCNLLGITSKVEMDRVEAEALVAAAKRYFTDVFEPTTRITASLLREMHHAWLGDIYPWAGVYRTVEVTKDGFSWPPAHLIPDHMERLSCGLLAKLTPCRPEKLPHICQSIAMVHAELLLIPPFREGNGRLARWLADIMAIQAGYPMPVYHYHGRGSKVERSRYLNAVIQGYGQRYEALTHFFFEAIRRGSADAAL